MDISGVYSELFAGKSVSLWFPNYSAAQTFRTRLHLEKKKEEMTLSVLGIESPRQQLSFKWAPDSSGDGTGVVTVKLTEPRPPVTYKVISIEDSTNNNGPHGD